jgi:hypothetical protein
MTDLVRPPEGPPPDCDAVGFAAEADAADDATLAELRRVAAQADPVPAAWRAAAGGAYAWLSAHGEPARLAYDARSAVAGLRSSGPAPVPHRSLRFVADGWGADAVVEVDVDVMADTLVVAGRLRPPRAVTVTLVVLDEVPSTTDAADDGAFRFDELPRRPFYLLAGGVMACKTAWVMA